jgi:hypothetical protein
MVADAQVTVDHRGNPLRGPQLGPVAVRHGPFAQEPHEARFLLRREPGRAAGCRLRLQGRQPTRAQRVAPPQHTAGVAAHAPGDLMQGQLLLEQRDDPTPTLLQRLRRTLRSHGDTPFPDVSILLHYLCGSQ